MNHSDETKDLMPNCLMTLPDEILEKIMSYITYDEVSRCRLVCQRFNFLSRGVFKQGLRKALQLRSHCVEEIAEYLPRRPSKRYEHRLCDHYLIFESLLIPLRRLERYIAVDYCYFFPGKVLDEANQVMRYVFTKASKQKKISRYYILQEIEDLSEMASSYFEKEVKPNFKNKSSHRSQARLERMLCIQSRPKSISKSSCSSSSNHDSELLKKPIDVPKLESKCANEQITTLQNKLLKLQKISALQDQKLKQYENQIVAISQHLKLPFSSQNVDQVSSTETKPETPLNAETSEPDFESSKDCPSAKRSRLSPDLEFMEANTGPSIEPGTSEASNPNTSDIKVETSTNSAPRTLKVKKDNGLKISELKKERKAVRMNVVANAHRPITRSFASKKTVS